MTESTQMVKRVTSCVCFAPLTILVGKEGVTSEVTEIQKGLVTMPMGAAHRCREKQSQTWLQVTPAYEVLPERIGIAAAEDGAEDNTLTCRPQEAKCKICSHE